MVPLKSRDLFLVMAGAAPAFVLFLVSGAALAASPRPSVTVLNQPVKNNAIGITYANLPRDGYLVVLGSDARGMPNSVAMGVIDLKAGDHRDIKVGLQKAPRPGQKLWVSLYDESDGKPVFNAKADKPMWTGKLPAQNAFIVQ